MVFLYWAHLSVRGCHTSSSAPSSMSWQAPSQARLGTAYLGDSSPMRTLPHLYTPRIATPAHHPQLTDKIGYHHWSTAQLTLLSSFNSVVHSATLYRVHSCNAQNCDFCNAASSTYILHIVHCFVTYERWCKAVKYEHEALSRMTTSSRGCVCCNGHLT